MPTQMLVPKCRCQGPMKPVGKMDFRLNEEGELVYIQSNYNCLSCPNTMRVVLWDKEYEYEKWVE